MNSFLFAAAINTIGNFPQSTSIIIFSQIKLIIMVADEPKLFVIVDKYIEFSSSEDFSNADLRIIKKGE